MQIIVGALLCCCCCSLVVAAGRVVASESYSAVDAARRVFEDVDENGSSDAYRLVVEDTTTRQEDFTISTLQSYDEAITEVFAREAVSVPICCEPGLYFYHSECIRGPETAANVEFPSVYTDELRPSNKTVADFRIVAHYPCQSDSFGIDPVEDIYYFLENGTILTVNLTQPALITQADYCLAVIRNEYNASETVVAVCLPPDIGIPVIYSIFNLISAMFLIATFFIYTVIPDLQNIHGFIIRAYVSVLAVAYCALAVVQLSSHFVLYNEPLCETLGSYLISSRGL